MRTIALGDGRPLSTRLAYGCMRVLGTGDPASVDDGTRASAARTIIAAFEAGYNHFDTADIYCGGESERALGLALRDRPDMRDGAIVATKCGVRLPESADGIKTFDFSADWIERRAEGSLARLGVDRIDLYLLHRPDYLMDPHEVAAAFDRLHAAGKVEHFGVSNMSIPQIDALARVCDRPIVCNQIELHPLRIDPFEDGELWEHMSRGIAVTAWSPVMGGAFAAGGSAPPGHPSAERIAAVCAALDEVAAGRGVDRTAITLAWLMRHPAGIVPIVGSAAPERVVRAVAADEIQLDRREWYRILGAARGCELP